MVGLGIGLILGVAEGLVIGSLALVRRGALVGLTVGALGGVVGALSGQVGFAVSGGGADAGAAMHASLFSEQMERRLRDAGARRGVIEIGLAWQNRNDLDLHVVDPLGERIFFDHRLAERSGGWLDVDRNAACRENIADDPVEHVVWEKNPPAGSYQVFVMHYQNCGPSDPTEYQVEIKNGGQCDTFSGTISFDSNRPTQHVHTFAFDPNAPAVSGGGGGLGPLLARLLGWTLFGALVGSAEGLTRRSLLGLRNAVLGGAIGGAMGGLAFALIVRVILPLGYSDTLGRFLGFVILGACIGLWIVLIERALSAILRVRSGRYEGREIFLDRSEMRIGRNETLEIYLGGDPDLRSHHATLRREADGYVLVAEGNPVQVNGTDVQRHSLRHGDLIEVGRTRLVYDCKLGGRPASSGAAPTTAPTKPTPPPPPPPAGTSGQVPAPSGMASGAAKGSASGPRPSPEKPSGGGRPSAPPPPPPPKRKP